MSNTIEIKIVDPRAATPAPPAEPTSPIAPSHSTPKKPTSDEIVFPESLVGPHPLGPVLRQPTNPPYPAPPLISSAPTPTLPPPVPNNPLVNVPTYQPPKTPVQEAAARAYAEEQKRQADRDDVRRSREERTKKREEERAAEAAMSYDEKLDRDAKRAQEREDRRKDVADRRNKLNPPTVPAYNPPEVEQVKSGKTAQPRGTEAKQQSQQQVGQIGQIAGGAGVEDANMIAGAATGNPVAIAMLAIKAIDKLKTDIGDKVRAIADVSEGVGSPVEKAARGDNAKAMTEVTQGFIDLHKKLPFVGEAFGVVADTAMRIGKAFAGVVEAFIERGRELSQYSGGLAQSYAISDVKNLMQDIKESQAFDAAGLGSLNDATTDMSIMLREFLLPIKEWLITELAEFVKWLKTQLPTVIRMVEVGFSNLTEKVEVLIYLADPTSKSEELDRILVKHSKDVAEAYGRERKRLQQEADMNINGLANIWLNAIDNFNPFPGQNLDKGRAPNPRARPPVIPGA